MLECWEKNLSMRNAVALVPKKCCDPGTWLGNTAGPEPWAESVGAGPGPRSRAGHGSGEGGSDEEGKGCRGQAQGISLQTPRCHVAPSTELGGPSWKPPELVGGAVPPGRRNLGISGFSGAFPGWPAGQRAPWWRRGGGSAPLPLAPSAQEGPSSLIKEFK